MISREGIPGLGLRGRLDLEYYPALFFTFQLLENMAFFINLVKFLKRNYHRY